MKISFRQQQKIAKWLQSDCKDDSFILQKTRYYLHDYSFLNEIKCLSDYDSGSQIKKKTNLKPYYMIKEKNTIQFRI